MISIGIFEPKPNGGVATWLDSLHDNIDPSLYHIRSYRSLFEFLTDSTLNVRILWGKTLFFAPFFRNKVSITHGAPSYAEQGVFIATLIWLSIFVASAFSKNFFVVSAYSSSLILSVIGKKVKVLRNTISSSRFNALIGAFQGPRHFDFMYAGRITPCKFSDEIRSFFISYREAGKLLIVSQSSDLITLNTSNFKPGCNLKAWSSVPQLAKYFSSSKVFVSGSPSEPFGYVFLEALIAGCCIVSPRSAGALEISSFGFQDRFFFYDPFDIDDFTIKCNQALHHFNLSEDEYSLLLERTRNFISFLNQDFNHKLIASLSSF